MCVCTSPSLNKTTKINNFFCVWVKCVCVCASVSNKRSRQPLVHQSIKICVKKKQNCCRLLQFLHPNFHHAIWSRETRKEERRKQTFQLFSKFMIVHDHKYFNFVLLRPSILSSSPQMHGKFLHFQFFFSVIIHRSTHIPKIECY